ncbi:MAG: hypothetical protein AAGL89_14225 [Pseudomonadota bacterium]
MSAEDLIDSMDHALRMEAQQIAGEQGITVPEVMAQVTSVLQTLRRRRGLVVINGDKGKD